MTRTQKLVVALVLFVPVLIMAALGILHCCAEIARLLEDAQDLVADEASRQIGREVRIGKAALTPLGRLVLEDVAVSQGPSFDGGTLATIKRIALDYDHAAVLLRGAGTGAVERVEIVEPRIWLVRFGDGSLNIADLLRPTPGPPRAPFSGLLRAANAEIVFRDYYPLGSGPPRITILTGTDLLVDARRARNYVFEVSAQGPPRKLALLKASGLFDAARKRLLVDAAVRGLDVPYAANSLGVRSSSGVTGGTADLNAAVSVRLVGDPKVLSAVGVLGIEGVSGILPAINEPVRGLGGTIVFGADKAVVRVSGSFAGSQANVVGTVSGFEQPRLKLDVQVRDVNVPRLARATGLPLSAGGIMVPKVSAARIRVAGPAAAPRFEIAASAPRGMFQGYSLKGIRADLVYVPGMLWIRSAEANHRDTQIRLGGTVGTSGAAALGLNGRVRGFDLGRLPVPLKYPVSGTADADFTVIGSASEPKVSVTASARNVRVAGRMVESVEASAEVSNRQVRLHSFRAGGVANGTVTAQGTYDYNEMDVSVAASGLQVSSLATLVNAPWIGGVAYVRGNLSGTPDSPFLRGDIEVYRPKYRSFEADYARASFGADRQSATLASGVVRLFPAEMHLSGTVNGLDREQFVFEGNGQVQRLSLDRVFETLGRRLDVNGTIGGEFSASGVYDLRDSDSEFPFKNALASGSLRLEDGAAFGYPVEDAVGRLTFEDNVLTMSEMVIASERARLGLGGSVYVDRRELDVDFSLTGFELARAKDKFSSYFAASGTVDAHGSVTGEWSKPRVDVMGESRDLVVNGMAFDKAVAAASYSGRTVSSGRLELAGGGQEYECSVIGLDLAQRHLSSGSAQVTNANLVDIWHSLRSSPLMKTKKGRRLEQILDGIPRPNGGTLNATASLSGSLDSPDGVLSVQGKDLGLDIHRIQSLELAASAEAGVVDLQHLTAASGDAYLNANGSPLYDKGNLNLALSLGNLDLSRFNYRLGGSSITGALSVELEASGRVKSPDATLSAEVLTPGIGGYTYDRLRASRIDIAGGLISVPDPDSGIILAVGNHQIVGHGFLPWDWATLKIPRSQPLRFSAGLRNEDLSILGSFASVVDRGNTKGPTEAVLTMAGTLDAPSYDGMLRVEDGTLALQGFTNVFQNVNADVKFDGNKVVVNDLSAGSSLGGSIGIRPGGSVAVTGTDRPVDLLLLSDGLKLEQRNVFGINEMVSLRLDAGLTIGGSLSAPVVADADRQKVDIGSVPSGIVISDALARFAIPEKLTEGAPLQLPASPRFDLGIKIGNGVRLQPPSMDITVTGGGRIHGRFADAADPLEVALDISAKKGSLYLATSRLTISPDSALSIRYLPPAEPKVTLKGFKATTSLTATNELGSQERYQIALEASGPVNNMQFTTSSNPPGLSRQRILMALGRVEGIFDSDEQGLENDIAMAVTAVGSSALFRPVEKVFTEQLGFEQFSLEYSTSSPLSLFMSTKLTDNLDFSYYRRLQSSITKQSQSEYQARLGWRFRRNYQLSLGIDDQQVLTGHIDFTKAFR